MFCNFFCLFLHYTLFCLIRKLTEINYFDQYIIVFIFIDDDMKKALAFKNVLAHLFDNNYNFTEDMLDDLFSKDVVVEFLRREDRSLLVSSVHRVV